MEHDPEWRAAVWPPRAVRAGRGRRVSKPERSCAHPQDFGQFARRLDLTDTMQIGVERDDIAAPIVGRKIRPEAGFGVARERPDAAILARWIERQQVIPAHAGLAQPAFRQCTDLVPGSVVDGAEYFAVIALWSRVLAGRGFAHGAAQGDF